MVIPKAIEWKKLEVIVPESEVDNTQKLTSIEKDSSKFHQQNRKRRSPTSSKSEVEEEYETTKIYNGDEYCYRHQRSWAKKRKLNISMWPKPNIFSCHGISINFLLSKEEIDDDLYLIREGTSTTVNI
ncbi:hypothetical protein HHI36_009756 [Cryptolaemus montrouzieri]|uniref:Uncharacterized protein n=1 Tax=Cryptolaemus montrouzieri TaxID=559131 RepID=A0ABD2MGQ3_9CUCU